MYGVQYVLVGCSKKTGISKKYTYVYDVSQHMYTKKYKWMVYLRTGLMNSVFTVDRALILYEILSAEKKRDFLRDVRILIAEQKKNNNKAKTIHN